MTFAWCIHVDLAACTYGSQKAGADLVAAPAAPVEIGQAEALSRADLADPSRGCGEGDGGDDHRGDVTPDVGQMAAVRVLSAGLKMIGQSTGCQYASNAED